MGSDVSGRWLGGQCAGWSSRGPWPNGEVTHVIVQARNDVAVSESGQNGVDLRDVWGGGTKGQGLVIECGA